MHGGEQGRWNRRHFSPKPAIAISLISCRSEADLHQVGNQPAFHDPFLACSIDAIGECWRAKCIRSMSSMSQMSWAECRQRKRWHWRLLSLAQLCTVGQISSRSPNKLFSYLQSPPVITAFDLTPNTHVFIGSRFSNVSSFRIPHQLSSQLWILQDWRDNG